MIRRPIGFRVQTQVGLIMVMACMMMFVPVEMKTEADLVLSMPDILVVVAIGMPDGLNLHCGKTEVREIMVSHPC